MNIEVLLGERKFIGWEVGYNFNKEPLTIQQSQIRFPILSLWSKSWKV